MNYLFQTINLTIFFLLGFFFCIFIIGETQDESSGIVIENISKCENLSLTQTSFCLRDYISGFYNYTIRDDNPKTLEDIKNNGGDCRDYNLLYESLGEELGFKTYSFHIESENIGHRIAIIISDEGYCKLDSMSNPNCYLFENNINN